MSWKRRKDSAGVQFEDRLSWEDVERILEMSCGRPSCLSIINHFGRA